MIRGGTCWALAEKVERTFKEKFPLDENAKHLIEERQAGRMPTKVRDGRLVRLPIHIRLAQVRSVLRIMLGGLQYKSFKASAAGGTASVLFRKTLPDGKVRDFRISLEVSRMSNLGEYGSNKFWAPNLIGYAVLYSINRAMRDPDSHGLEHEIIVSSNPGELGHEWHSYSSQHPLRRFVEESGLSSLQAHGSDVEYIVLWNLFEEIGFDKEVLKVIDAFQGSIGDKAKANRKKHETKVAKAKIRPHIKMLLSHGITQDEIIDIVNEVLVESVLDN
jgi:hypothetical protein